MSQKIILITAVHLVESAKPERVAEDGTTLVYRDDFMRRTGLRSAKSVTTNLSVLEKAGFITKINRRTTAERIDPETGEIQRYNKTELRIRLNGGGDGLLMLMAIAHRAKNSKRTIKPASQGKRCAAHPHAPLYVTEVEAVACSACHRHVNERVSNTYLATAKEAVLEGGGTFHELEGKNYTPKDSHVVKVVVGKFFPPTSRIATSHNRIMAHKIGGVFCAGLVR